MEKVIVNNGRHCPLVNIASVEEKYNAKFVGQFCLKTIDGTWADAPADVYYVANPNKELGHSHYFGIIVRNSTVYITKGDSGVEGSIYAVIADDGEVLYSKYRHDFNESKDKSVWIDGGRDYTRTSSPTIELKIVDGEFYKV